jgi:predicted CXXCH cytochrome family protein
MNAIRNCSFLILLMLGFSAPQAMAQSSHDFAGQCGLCHTSDPSAGGALSFVGDVGSVCLQCHQLSGGASHPTNLLPEIALPSGFWLDDAGRLNCATCHNPHPAGPPYPRALLRDDSAGSDFCKRCHQSTVAGKSHQGAVLLAHPQLASREGSDEGTLDDASVLCINCHDGTNGPHANFCLLRHKGECAGHYLGLNYRMAADRKEDLRREDALPPEIVLYEGKVGCLSCHDIYAKGANLLVMSNSRSALCTTCHLK